MMIGVSGKKQSGKDTSLGIIKTFLGEKYNIRHYYFSRVVKHFGETYFGVDPKTKNKELFRFVWQGIGKMMREEVQKDYWIQQEYQEYLKDKNLYDNILGVVTDVRYRNEADFFVQNNFPLIRIYRPGVFSSDSHESEVELDNYNFDYVIVNDGSIEDLKQKWKTTLESINL